MNTPQINNDVFSGLPCEVDKIIAIIKRLREPGGCPWDIKQTHESLVKHLVEESQEVKHEIEQGNHGEELMEELGDLLLQVFLHARIAEEAGRFNFNDVAETLRKKLVFRHPHVFGANPRELSQAELDKQWEELKKIEKQKKAGRLKSE